MHNDGQAFSEIAQLIHMTSHVFEVRMCTFGKRKSGWAKTRPAEPLATAMKMNGNPASF